MHGCDTTASCTALLPVLNVAVSHHVCAVHASYPIVHTHHRKQLQLSPLSCDRASSVAIQYSHMHPEQIPVQLVMSPVHGPGFEVYDCHTF